MLSWVRPCFCEWPYDCCNSPLFYQPLRSPQSVQLLGASTFSASWHGASDMGVSVPSSACSPLNERKCAQFPTHIQFRVEFVKPRHEQSGGHLILSRIIAEAILSPEAYHHYSYCCISVCMHRSFFDHHFRWNSSSQVFTRVRSAVVLLPYAPRIADVVAMACRRLRQGRIRSYTACPRFSP